MACCISVDPSGSPQWSCAGRCCRGEDASLLSIRRHNQHCISHGESRPPRQDPFEPNRLPVMTHIFMQENMHSHTLELFFSFWFPHPLSTYPRALKNKSFVIQKRGEIEVKGKGRMTTYFLERNGGGQQIMGVSDLQTGARQQDGQMSCQPGLHRPGLFAVYWLTLHLLNWRTFNWNCCFLNVLQSLSDIYQSLSLSSSLSSSTVASQRQRRDDLCLIPMKYGDSLSKSLPSSHTSDPQTGPAMKPRDSESYGSLHTDDQSGGGAPDTEDHQCRGNQQSKQTHGNQVLCGPVSW